METTQYKHYIGTPFCVKILPVTNNPGTWNSSKVEILRTSGPENIVIGEYIRNYHSYGTNTFHPFQINGEWYALYSASYTATRVMKLYDDRIEDWCGEEKSSNGFCPVEFYIPQYNKHLTDTNLEYYQVDSDFDTLAEFVKDRNESDFMEAKYCDFGFLCGCVWGDDSSWKLRYIDLTKIPEKELIITDKFGYWQLPSSMTLRECVIMSNWEPDHNWIELAKAEQVNLTTGERH